MERIWVGFGGLIGLSAVAMAAVAAHAPLEPAALAALRSAVEMQGWHALALLFCGVWAPRGGIWVHLAGACFIAGLALFCTGVYATAFWSTHLGPVAPTGGTILMIGWACLGISALRARA